MIRKKIPDSEAEFDSLLQSLNEKCSGYKTILNISDEQLAALDVNATCYHACRLMKNQLNDTKVSFTQFVKKVFKGDPKGSMPSAPSLNFVLPAMSAKPGIEKQTEKFIEYLELQDNFSDTIGLDLGFYVETSGAAEPDTLTGDFKIKDLSGYAFNITFRKQGQDAFDLRWRFKGASDWTKILLTRSPYRLQIPPDENGLAVTLEMQGILIRKNEPVGQMSDLKTVIARA
jgi:hypothetical protein